MEPVASEIVVAVAGLRPFLFPGRRLRMTHALRDDAAALPFRWRRQVRRFLDGGETAFDAPVLPPQNVAEVVAAITAEHTPDEIAGRLDLDDAELAIEVATAAARPMAIIRQTLPTRARVTLMGSTPTPPSDVEMSRFRLLWHTLNDPSVILSDLCAGILGRRQVNAFRVGYPALYDLVHGLVMTEAVRWKGDHPSGAELPRRREAMLKLLLGLEPDVTLLRRLQANHASGASALPPGASGPLKHGGGDGGGDDAAVDALTPTQKSATDTS